MKQEPVMYNGNLLQDNSVLYKQLEKDRNDLLEAVQL